MNLGWRVATIAELVTLVTDRSASGQTTLVAVDGHSSSGKSTFGRRLVAALPDAALLHTDDLAWHHGVLTWDGLLRDDVLPVVRAGNALDYRPPQWQARSRPGSITLPGSLACLVIEGVGASQPSVRARYDLVCWVETDEPTRLARDVPRVTVAGEISAQGYTDWMAEENAYTTRERPWEHADLLVYGGESIRYDPESEVVLGPSLRRPR